MGTIVVYGQFKVKQVLKLPNTNALVQRIRVCDSIYLLVQDAAQSIHVYDLRNSELAFTWDVGFGNISAIGTDPSMSYCYVGMGNGQIRVLDLKRGRISDNYRIDNLQRSVFPNLRMSPVIDILVHPRDLGTILVVYVDSVIAFSLLKQEILFGVKGDTPISRAQWSPIGVHVVTTHANSDIIIWDSTEGVKLHTFKGSENGGEISQIAWSFMPSGESSIIVSSGSEVVAWDYTPLPNPAITSYANMTAFYKSPKGKRVFPFDSTVVDLMLIPRGSPHYNMGYDPVGIAVLLESTDLRVVSMPDGRQFNGELPRDFTWMSSPVTAIDGLPVERSAWLGKLLKPEPLLIGGAPERVLKRPHDAVVAGHLDGSIEIFDSVETFRSLYLNVCEVLERVDQVALTKVAYTLDSLVAAVETGEAIIYKYGSKHSFPRQGQNSTNQYRTDGKKEGYIPSLLVNNTNSPESRVTAIHNAENGFIVICYSDGAIYVIDLRGPAIIYNENISQLGVKKSSNPFGRKKNSSIEAEYGTAVEIGIYQLSPEDRYSSIAFVVGTNTGNLHFFRILPKGAMFTVQYDSTLAVLNSKIQNVFSVDAENAEPASAKISNMQKLSSGTIIPAYIIAISQTQIRVVRPTKQKLTSANFLANVVTSGICSTPSLGTLSALCITSTGATEAYAIPSLRSITTTALPVDNVLPSSKILENGDVVVQSSKTSGFLVDVLGRGNNFAPDMEGILYDYEKAINPRPTVGAIGWLKGRPYVGPNELNKLFGRPEDPNESAYSSRQVDNDSQNQRNRVTNANTGGSGFIRTLQKKMDEFEETANDYLNGISETVSSSVSDAQDGAMKGLIRGKFF